MDSWVSGLDTPFAQENLLSSGPYKVTGANFVHPTGYHSR